VRFDTWAEESLSYYEPKYHRFGFVMKFQTIWLEEIKRSVSGPRMLVKLVDVIRTT
jgi:hypothetical protein